MRRRFAAPARPAAPRGVRGPTRTGVARLDGRTVSFTDDDPLRLFRTFMNLVFLTRSLVEPS